MSSFMWKIMAPQIKPTCVLDNTDAAFKKGHLTNYPGKNNQQKVLFQVHHSTESRLLTLKAPWTSSFAWKSHENPPQSQHTRSQLRPARLFWKFARKTVSWSINLPGINHILPLQCRCYSTSASAIQPLCWSFKEFGDWQGWWYSTGFRSRSQAALSRCTMTSVGKPITAWIGKEATHASWTHLQNKVVARRLI